MLRFAYSAAQLLLNRIGTNIFGVTVMVHGQPDWIWLIEAPVDAGIFQLIYCSEPTRATQWKVKRANCRDTNQTSFVLLSVSRRFSEINKNKTKRRRVQFRQFAVLVATRVVVRAWFSKWSKTDRQTDRHGMELVDLCSLPEVVCVLVCASHGQRNWNVLSCWGVLVDNNFKECFVRSKNNNKKTLDESKLKPKPVSTFLLVFRRHERRCVGWYDKHTHTHNKPVLHIIEHRRWNSRS